MNFSLAITLLIKFLPMQPFPRLGSAQRRCFAKNTLCAYCCAKQRHSAAECGTISCCFHHTTYSLNAISLTLQIVLCSHSASLSLQEERYGQSFFSPIWEECSLGLSSSSALNATKHRNPFRFSIPDLLLKCWINCHLFFAMYACCTS